MDDAGLRPRSLILYAHIVRRANREGFCFASNAALVDDMSAVDPVSGAVQVITERTLQAMLAELRERGHIHMDQGAYPPDKNGVIRTGRRIFIGRRLDVPPAGLQGGEENFTPEEIFTRGVKKTSPPFKCSNNKSYKPPNIPHEVMEAVEAYAGTDGELLDGIREFLLNRAAPPNANPVKTAYGMRRLLKDLDRLSGGNRRVKLAMLDKAIKNNWRGLFALKADELPAADPPAGKETYGWQ